MHVCVECSMQGIFDRKLAPLRNVPKVLVVFGPGVGDSCDMRDSRASKKVEHTQVGLEIGRQLRDLLVLSYSFLSIPASIMNPLTGSETETDGNDRYKLSETVKPLARVPILCVANLNPINSHISQTRCCAPSPYLLCSAPHLPIPSASI